MKVRIAFSVFAAALLSGCASGYSQFYQAADGATPEAIAQTRTAPAPAIPKLERSADTPENIANAYGRYGYAVIGYSSFNGAAGQSEQGALDQGKKVGADLVVVVNPQYTNTVSSVIPLSLPTTQTSYTSGSATAYGPGGPVTAYGNATTTTYGSKTTYIPTSTDRFDYGAIYFVKRTYVLGANWRDLTDGERQALQSNKGVYVLGVVNGSPAFDSDVLVGDIILSIDGQAATDQEGFSELVKARRGTTVELLIARDNQLIKKVVSLNR
ncbi:PDZ domain-containing protein [Lysobacter soli]|uniref:PDZ domain-containing protein n=1 Tax=Lysobacter soli TaxID=453783 RepID=UPI0036ADEE87